jgi:hypothetical protein
VRFYLFLFSLYIGHWDQDREKSSINVTFLKKYGAGMDLFFSSNCKPSSFSGPFFVVELEENLINPPDNYKPIQTSHKRDIDFNQPVFGGKYIYYHPGVYRKL